MVGARRDVGLTLAKLSAIASAAGTGLYLTLGVEPSESANYLLSFLPFLAVLLWLERDAQRTQVGAVHDLGLFLLLGWWAVIPWYSFKTRGRAGLWMTVGLFALIAAPLIGAVVTALLLLPFRVAGV
jgi:hypothetical protein